MNPTTTNGSTTNPDPTILTVDDSSAIQVGQFVIGASHFWGVNVTPGTTVAAIIDAHTIQLSQPTIRAFQPEQIQFAFSVRIIAKQTIVFGYGNQIALPGQVTTFPAAIAATGAFVMALQGQQPQLAVLGWA